MELATLTTAAQSFMTGLPMPVIDALADVDLIIAETVELATLALVKEFGSEFDAKEMPQDCKGIFVGTPTEIEESDDSEEDEIVYFPEGSVVLCAANIATEEEGMLVLMHEIGHALGMDEDEVKQLGLGVVPSNFPVNKTEETKVEETKPEEKKPDDTQPVSQ